MIRVIGLWLMMALPVAASECRPEMVDLRGPWGQAHFSVEVADSADERAKGLMFRESLPGSAGMVFIYPAPQRAQFWMKNTLIPLDLIFADRTGKVVRVHSQARPQDLSTIDGGENVLLVLEINGGLAKRLEIGRASCRERVLQVV